MKKKKLLITGGSHAEVPLIRAAKNQGWYVISTGTNKDGIGHRYSDKYVCGDFSDKDFVLRLAKEEEVSAIVSGCNDFAYLSAAYACDKLHLPGHDTYEISCKIHHKDNFRSECRKVGIRSPMAITCCNVDDAIEISKSIGYPVIVKPVDLTGGKGVHRCCNDEEVKKAFCSASCLTREDKVLIEQFIDGSNHGGSFLLRNCMIVAGVIDDEQYGLNKYLVSGATMPSSVVSENTLRQLISDIETLSQHLGLVDGLFHVQFIVAKDGYPYMIDPCRRSPGDLYVLLSSFSSMIDFPLEIVKAESGEQLPQHYDVRRKFIARECIMAKNKGYIEDIFIDDSILDKIIYKMLWFKRGELVDDPLKYKAGILIMEFSTEDEMNRMVENFDSLVKIKLREKTYE